MDTPIASALSGLWADATPLSEYLEKQVTRLSIEAPAMPIDQTDKSVKHSGFTLVLTAHVNAMAARAAAPKAILNDLIAGRTLALGRPSNSYIFERIDPAFWIGAAVDWADGTVRRDGKSIVEVRIPSPDALRAIQPTPPTKPAASSRVDVIREAIAEYAKQDPRLARPPHERYRAYRIYISARGFDPRRERGFGEKTFELREREFRSGFK